MWVLPLVEEPFVEFFQYAEISCALTNFGFLSTDVFYHVNSIFRVNKKPCLALWIGACMTGLVLLINRALDLINKYYADMLFAGRRTYIWLIFPFLLFLYVCLFTKPFIFNSILDASFTNPFLGIPEAHINERDVF